MVFVAAVVVGSVVRSGAVAVLAVVTVSFRMASYCGPSCSNVHRG